jgi:hypothetical protein
MADVDDLDDFDLEAEGVPVGDADQHDEDAAGNSIFGTLPRFSSVAVTVKNPMGGAFSETLYDFTTIRSLKSRLFVKCGMRPQQMELLWRERVLADGETAGALGLRSGDVLTLWPRVRAGFRIV